MEIQNASTTSIKSNQMRNINTVRRESGNVTTQPWGINNRKSEVIAFLVNAGINVTANNFLYSNLRKKFLCLKCLLYLTEVLLDTVNVGISRGGFSRFSRLSYSRKLPPCEMSCQHFHKIFPQRK